ncbi:hypothetical protein [Nonomuraea helvata]|uniref:DUF3995 domain-containing protein n=1 Tax=Nonomuraea helvata TaxID=37484 RepID=A0ABV5RQP2_9ACTN
MNRLWYLIGALLVLVGLVHLGVFVVDGGPWETAFDTTVSRTLAAGGGVLIAIAITMTVAAFRPDPDVAPSMRLAVRAGFATTLKPAHAVFMHGALLLPALAWLLSRTLPSEAARLRWIR